MSHDSQFRLFTPIDKIKCSKCKLIYSYRNVSDPQHGSFLDTLECNKCKKLTLINCDMPHFKSIENFFYEKVIDSEGFRKHFPDKNILFLSEPMSRLYIDTHIDHQHFFKTIEAIIDPCECGGHFVLNSSQCPNCGMVMRESEILSCEVLKLTYELAPIRSLENIQKLQNPLVQEIFKNLSIPRTREEVDKQLKDFAKGLTIREKYYQPEHLERDT